MRVNIFLLPLLSLLTLCFNVWTVVHIHHQSEHVERGTWTQVEASKVAQVYLIWRVYLNYLSLHYLKVNRVRFGVRQAHFINWSFQHAASHRNFTRISRGHKKPELALWHKTFSRKHLAHFYLQSRLQTNRRSGIKKTPSPPPATFQWLITSAWGVWLVMSQFLKTPWGGSREDY